MHAHKFVAKAVYHAKGDRVGGGVPGKYEVQFKTTSGGLMSIVKI